MYLQNALWGIGFAVIALICLTVKEVWEKSERDVFFYAAFFISLFFIMFLRMTPVQTVLSMVFFGVLIKKFVTKERIEK